MDRRRLNSWIDDWARNVLFEANRSGISGINIVEKLLKDPGFTTAGGGHRVLWWPRNRRISAMSRIMHQIDGLSQFCLVIDSNHVIDHQTGQPITKAFLARNNIMKIREFNERIKKAKSMAYRLASKYDKEARKHKSLKRNKKKSTGHLYSDMR